jgi:DeoR/GlpR family transcriptional regulator of sugar metabolism
MVVVTDERREFIVEELARNQVVKVTDLSARFGISGLSIRRDLDRLEQLGLLKRVRGGAVAMPSSALHQVFSTRMRHRSAEKERIGRAAAEMIAEGDRIIFDSGTTVLQVAHHVCGDLLNSSNLTVITASLPIVRELGDWKGVHLILLGGIYLPEYEEVVGPQTIAALQELHADKMFLGADGLTFSRGVTTANQLEAEVDQEMIKASSEVILVADSSKIGVIGLTTVIPLTRVNKLVPDSGAPDDFVAALREQGVEVIKV